MAKRPNPVKKLPPELNAQQAITVAQNALNAGDYRLSAALMIKFAQAAPHFAPAHLAIGIAFNRMGRFADAAKRLDKASQISHDPNQPEAPNEQVEAGRRFNNFMIQTELTRAHIKNGNPEAAAEALALAVPFSEETGTLDAHTARLELAKGNPKAAADLVSPHLNGAETNVEIALAASEIALAAPDHLAPADLAEHLVATSKRVGLPAGILIMLLHATANVCDAAANYDDALAAWRRAAGIPKVQFKQRAYMIEIVSVSRGWDSEAISNVIRADTNDPTPILLVGMPGRALDSIARLIAAHPDAASAGPTEFLSETAEQRFGAKPAGNFTNLSRPGIIRGNDTREAGERYTKALQRRVGTSETPRIIDTNGLNNIQLGMLSVMNPHAHIVHVSDTPFNTCFDSWSSSSAYAHPFIADATSLALYWRGDANLTHHWAKTFAEERSRQPFYTLDISNFRKSPEETARALFMFLGLDWSDQLKQAATDTANERRPDPENYKSRLKALTGLIERTTITPEQIEQLPAEA